MVRWVLGFAVVGVAFVLVHAHFQGAANSVPAQAQVNLSQVPPQFRSLLASRPDPAAILASRGALPGLGVIRRLAGGGSSNTPPSPPQTQPFGDVGTRAQVRAVERGIRRDIADLNRLSEGAPATPEEVQETLALVYSASVLKALGPSGRAAFAARVAGTTRASQHVRVLDFDGVFVAGDHALAQVVYRISVRAPSGRFIARPPATWTVTLVREGGRWRFVRGFEGDT
jgi:hypothetical protein